MLKLKKMTAFALAFLILFLSSTTFVLATEQQNNNKNIILNVSIKNEVTKDFYLSETVNLDSDFSIMNMLDELSNRIYIKTYEIQNNNIYSITPINSSEITNQSNNQWTYYINGTEFNKDVKRTILNSNDNVEIVYKNENYQYNPENSIVSFDYSDKLKAQRNWDEQFNNTLGNAINYLKLNNYSQDYISAIAMSGNFMDIVEFNRMVAISDKKEYNTPMDISNTILALTFSGVNAQDVRGVNLLEKLYNFKDYNIQGPMGAAYMLLAFDCDNYQIPANASNTREKLIEYLLSTQKSDGGFSNQQDDFSKILDTSIVLTALSKYRHNVEISEVIRKALNFLSKQKYDNCIDLSSIIIALKSLNISLDDNRFLKAQIGLLDQLSNYANNDGGFKNIMGGKSEAYSTEIAIIAIIAFKNNQNPYVFRDTVQSGYFSNEESALSLEVHNIKSSLFYDVLIVIILLTLTFVLIKLRKNSINKELSNEK